MKTIKSVTIKAVPAFIAIILLLSVQMGVSQKSEKMKDENMKLKREYANDDEFKNDAHAKFAKLQSFSNKLEQRIAKAPDTKLKGEMTELNGMINHFLADRSKYESGNYNDANRKNDMEHLKNQFEQIRIKYMDLRDRLKNNKSGNGLKQKKQPQSKEDKM